MTSMDERTLAQIKEVTGKQSLKADEFAEFDCADGFNDGLPLKGYLCRRGDEMYGFLWLTEIGGEPTTQWVWATPKLHYPQGKSGQFHWPERVRRLLVYPKLDGTNVLAYSYLYQGERYLTFKTRLTAVMQNNRFSPLQDLWCQCLKMYPGLRNWLYEETERQSVAFEMFGNLNTILVRYDVPIDCRQIFRVSRSSAAIEPPSGLCAHDEISDRTWAFDDDDLIDVYEEIREREEHANDVDNQVFRSEGAVMYTESPAGWQMWKAKPPSIEHIHRGISDAAIYTTAQNAFENWDEPTYENVRDLLMEEWPGQFVDNKRTKIEKALAEIRERLELNAKVVDVMVAEGLIFDPERKGETMRALSRHFPKSQMRRVYQAVVGA